MARDTVNVTDWNAVAARALAFQALIAAGLGDKRVTEKAKFLMTLGVARADAAALLGSSDDSLRILLGREARKDAGPAAKVAADAL